MREHDQLDAEMHTAIIIQLFFFFLLPIVIFQGQPTIHSRKKIIVAMQSAVGTETCCCHKII